MALLAVGLLAVPVGLILLYLAFTTDASAPRPTLTGATEATAANGAVAAPDATSSVLPAGNELDGQWSIERGNDSWVSLLLGDPPRNGSPEPVRLGTSSPVEGGVVLRGGTLQAAVFQTDLRGLTDADPAVGQAVARDMFATDRYPLARLRFDDDVKLPAPMPFDTPMPITLTGELLLHGTTKPVTLTGEVHVARNRGLVLRLRGSLTIALADFGIEPTPSVPNSSSVDRGTVDLELVLVHKATPGTIDRSITG